MWLMLSESLAQRVTWTLIHFAWQGAAIAAVLAIVLRTRWGPTPQRRYAASVAALITMVLCVLATFLVLNLQAADLSQSLALLPQWDKAPVQVSVNDPITWLQPYLLI